VFGGDISGTKGTVTKFLIGSNVAVWLLTVFLAVAAGQVSGSQIGSLLTSGGETAFTQDFAAVPYFLTNGGLAFGGIASGEFYRLLTSDFLHYGIVHIGFNMYALWILGRECERLLGRWRFLLLYLLTGVGGATAVYLFGSPNALVAGASSSIFGLIGAMVFFFKKLQADMRGLIGLIVLNVAITLFVPGISILGHAGGFVLGSALGAVLAYAPAGPMRKQLQLAGIAGVALVMVAVVAARTVQLGLLGVSLP
jgi:membrane associated rhomboid family serine protease